MTPTLICHLVTMANAAFTILRVVANVPQLLAVARDPCGARAISVSSWIVFAAANACNGTYALVVAGDPVVFAVSCPSVASCATIAAVAWLKQRRARRREQGGAVPA